MPWARGTSCSSPRRFRWGKRWASLARAPRAVPLALDLASQSRDPHVLGAGLRVTLPELGLTAAEPEPAVTPNAAPSASATASPAPKTRGCAFVAPRANDDACSLLFVALASCLALRRRNR
jgi:hypothetical protein